MNRLRASAVAAIAAAVAAGSVSAATLAPASAQTAGTETGQQQVAGIAGTSADNPVVVSADITVGKKVEINLDPRRSSPLFHRHIAGPATTTVPAWVDEVIVPAAPGDR